jgi:hypothetical protein
MSIAKATLAFSAIGDLTPGSPTGMETVMERLYIKGLVRIANAVRRDMSGPLSADRRKKLRRFVEESLRQVDAILASHGVSLEDLPAPTRRAYQFLAGLNFDEIIPQGNRDPDRPAPGSVSLVGLKSFHDRILRSLAQPISAEQANAIHSSIQSMSERVEEHLNENGLSSGELTAQTRAARGWLAFFSDRENLNAYLAAADRARPRFEAAIQRNQRFRPAVFLEFRTIAGLYKLRGYRNGTRIMLATPMICFSQQLFESLANAAFKLGSRQPIIEAALSDEYQAIQAELEALGGVEEQTAGLQHDLQASFDRVNAKYFGGSLARPRLSWSRSLSSRKLGHYDPIRDTVMVSSILDRADVEGYLLDFVMYHELLHKALGVDWRNGRQAIHTPEFRAKESKFEHCAAAEAALSALAHDQTAIQGGA